MGAASGAAMPGMNGAGAAADFLAQQGGMMGGGMPGMMQGETRRSIQWAPQRKSYEITYSKCIQILINLVIFEADRLTDLNISKI